MTVCYSELSSDEAKKVRQLVPLTQAEVFMTFKCNYEISNKRYEAGYCALSEHLIVFGKKSLFSISEVETIHIFNLKAMKIVNDTNVQLTLQNSKIDIFSSEAIHFARLLLRNYTLVTKLWPKQMVMEVHARNKNDLPPFSPHLSVAQLFQFMYNAYCSYFNVDYFHSVTRFFQKIIISGDAFADISKLPLTEVDTSFGDPMSLRPVLAAMMFCPMIRGYTMRNISRPDFLRSIAPTISNNTNIALLQCSNCMI